MTVRSKAAAAHADGLALHATMAGPPDKTGCSSQNSFALLAADGSAALAAPQGCLPAGGRATAAAAHIALHAGGEADLEIYGRNSEAADIAVPGAPFWAPVAVVNQA